jgi:hypothetical protein
MPEHIQFQTLWRRFMTNHPDVDCYFYKAHPDLQQPAFLEDRTLWIRMNDTFDTVYEKTLCAFDYFRPRLHMYDFVFRSNLSTFVAFQQMVDFCKDLPKTNCCAAVIGGIETNVPQSERISLNHPYSFPGGNGFLLSPDLVRRLIDDKEPFVHQDDVTIGNALRRWGVPIREFVRPDFQENQSWYVNNYDLLKPGERNMNPKKIMFSYRFKSTDRRKDIEEMDKFIRNVYNA